MDLVNKSLDCECAHYSLFSLADSHYKNIIRPLLGLFMLLKFPKRCVQGIQSPLARVKLIAIHKPDELSRTSHQTAAASL